MHVLDYFYELPSEFANQCLVKRHRSILPEILDKLLEIPAPHVLTEKESFVFDDLHAKILHYPLVVQIADRFLNVVVGWGSDLLDQHYFPLFGPESERSIRSLLPLLLHLLLIFILILPANQLLVTDSIERIGKKYRFVYKHFALDIGDLFDSSRTWGQMEFFRDDSFRIFLTVFLVFLCAGENGGVGGWDFKVVHLFGLYLKMVGEGKFAFTKTLASGKGTCIREVAVESSDPEVMVGIFQLHYYY